jgi:hypothetical protein
VEGRSYLHPVPYAKALTAEGYVALCIDHWCFGERGHTTELDTFKAMLWQGRVLWGMMVYDSIRALDWLLTRSDVDGARVATLGMSMGSSMAQWLGALDERVKATVDICCLTEYHTLLAEKGLKGHGIYYYVPGLLKHFTASDINALIAPRAHLGLAGTKDALTPLAGLDIIDRELKLAPRQVTRAVEPSPLRRGAQRRSAGGPRLPARESVGLRSAGRGRLDRTRSVFFRYTFSSMSGAVGAEIQRPGSGRADSQLVGGLGKRNQPVHPLPGAQSVPGRPGPGNFMMGWRPQLACRAPVSDHVRVAVQLRDVAGPRVVGRMRAINFVPGGAQESGFARRGSRAWVGIWGPWKLQSGCSPSSSHRSPVASTGRKKASGSESGWPRDLEQPPPPTGLEAGCPRRPAGPSGRAPRGPAPRTLRPRAPRANRANCAAIANEARLVDPAPSGSVNGEAAGVRLHHRSITFAQTRAPAPGQDDDPPRSRRSIRQEVRRREPRSPPRASLTWL